MCVDTSCGRYLTILNGAVVLVCVLASTMLMFLMLWNATQKTPRIGSKNFFTKNQLAHPQITRVKNWAWAKRLNTIQIVHVHYVEQRLQIYSRKIPFLGGWGTKLNCGSVFCSFKATLQHGLNFINLYQFSANSVLGVHIVVQKPFLA